jgi:hypothetical protein
MMSALPSGPAGWSELRYLEEYQDEILEKLKKAFNDPMEESASGT